MANNSHLPGNQPARAWMNLEKLIKAGYDVTLTRRLDDGTFALTPGVENTMYGDNLKLLIHQACEELLEK